jgi:hypothetical protein
VTLKYPNIAMTENNTKLNNPSNTDGSSNSLASHISLEAFDNQNFSLSELTELSKKTLIISQNAESSAKAVEKCAIEATANLVEIQSKLTEINNAATAVLATKTQITDQQAIIATKSDHIQEAQKHADDVRASLDRVLTSATKQSTDAEGQKILAQSAAEGATALLAEVRTTKVNIETDSTAVATARKIAEDSAEISKKLADKSNNIESRITEYETRLTDLQKQCQEQLQTIEALLPGAASAGLANAFDNRRKTFLKPQLIWQCVFVGSVIVLTLIAGTGFWHVYLSGVTPGYDEIIRLLIVRAPVVGFVVWLALHASQEAGLAKRLEEDYGYKSATAASFLGFHKHMSAIGTNAESNAPLAKLCSDTLETLACPPGRIYEKHGLIISPSDELSKGAKSLREVVAGAKSN